MIKLEKVFVSPEGGFSYNPLTYTQIAYNGRFTVYERSRNGKVMDYEVFKIHIVPKGTEVDTGNFKKTYEDDTEIYPSKGSWGHNAWTISNRETALKRFNNLSNTIVKEVKSISIPDKEFSTNDLAEQNSVNYIDARLFIQDALSKSTIKYVRDERRNGSRKPTRIFIKT